MNIKTTLKASVAAVALFAVAAPVQAGTISGKTDAKVQLSGQFNKAFFYGDNGDSARGQIVDNTISQSRIHITVTAPINEALTISGRKELGFSDNELGSTGLSDANNNGETSTVNGGGDEGVSVRETWIAISHKQFGTLKMGDHEEASDGGHTNAYNAAGNVVDAGSNWADAVDLVVSGAADGVVSGQQVGDFFQNYEGGDSGSVSYISPKFGGVGVKVGYSNSGTVSGGVSFGGKFGGFAVKVYGGYQNLSGSSATVDSQYSVSGGVKHDSGLSLSAGIGQEDNSSSAGNVEASSYWVLGAYEADLISAGSTGFAVQYMQQEDVTNEGDEGTQLTVGVEQQLGMGASVYAGYQLIEADRVATNYEDVSMFLTGARLNF